MWGRRFGMDIVSGTTVRFKLSFARWKGLIIKLNWTGAQSLDCF